MKTGNKFPRTRARWQASQVPTGGQNCPTWLRVVDLYAVYLNNEGGTPFPRVVTQTACQPARWTYIPTLGWVSWRGQWDDGVRNGFWELRQRAVSYDQVEVQATLTVVMDTFRFEYGYTTMPAYQNGTWSAAGPFIMTLTTNTVYDPPWATWLYMKLAPMTYAEIRAIGEDDQDTAPLSWDE